MSGSKVIFFRGDNGGRRLGINRRQFSYSFHIPERRYDQDRRTDDPDPRASQDSRNNQSRRRDLIEFNVSHNVRSDSDRRSFVERRAAFA